MKRYIKADIIDIDQEELDTRRDVAYRSTRPDVLERMSEDSDYFVVLDVAGNPNTPPEVLRKLSDRSYAEGIRAHVAENPNTPLDVFPELIRWGDESICRAIAINPRTPADLLNRLAKGTAPVAAAVAQNPSTPVDTLVYLVSRDNSYINCWVARNPNTPLYILKDLLQDHDYWVRESVKKNPNYVKL